MKKFIVGGTYSIGELSNYIKNKTLCKEIAGEIKRMGIGYNVAFRLSIKTSLTYRLEKISGDRVKCTVACIWEIY